MTLIDTHVHVNFDRFEADFEQVRDRWRAAGVSQLIHSCVHPQEFPRTQAIADQVRNCPWRWGYIPSMPKTGPKTSLARFVVWLKKSVGWWPIGETGLDFSRPDNRPKQITALRNN